jgi:hypothetical protein
MGEQFGDAKRAVNYLPKNMRSRLGQTADDLAQIGKKMTAVTTAAETVARKMENPVPPAVPAKAVSVKIPYTPIALGIAAVLAVVIFSQK